MTDNATKKSSEVSSSTSASHQQKRANRNDIVGRTQLPLPSLTGLEEKAQLSASREQEKITAVARPVFFRLGTGNEAASQIEKDPFPGAEPQVILPDHAAAKAERIAAPVSKRASWRFTLFTLLACLLIGGALVFSYSYFVLVPNTQAINTNPPKKATSIGIQTAPQNHESYTSISSMTNIHVGADPTLTINGQSGNVTIQAGASDTISINTYNQGIQMAQSYSGKAHDAINIVPQRPDENVNYAITVPPTTQVSIAMDSGSISVKGVSAATINTTNGTMDIENIHGTVQAITVNSNITLQNIAGQMTLKTVNGTIKAGMVQGKLNATTQYGDVIIQQATLSDPSILKTSHGSVHFTGTLNPNGSYSIATDSGNIILTLPQNAAFQLQASTQSGSVSNAFGANSVGNTPQAQIVATIGSGSVTIQKQDGGK